MNTNINFNALKKFVISEIGGSRIDAKDAKNLDIDADKFSELDRDESDYAELSELLDDKDIYEQFATMFVEEQEKDTTKDKEKEKEEQLSIKDKNKASA